MLAAVDELGRPPANPGTLRAMSLDDIDELDLAYLLIWGEHPDLPN